MASLLVVAGESDQMRSLCETLQPNGYTATCLTSAETALAKLREQAFDLVITDVSLPDMDGIAFLRTARAIDPDLVGIVMTGQRVPDSATLGMEDGPLDYIVKPFTLSDVLPVLARAHGVRRLRLANVHLQQAIRIYELSMVIRLTLDFQLVLQKVADAAMAHTRVDGVSILLPGEDGRVLNVAISRGQSPSLDEGKQISLGKGISRWAERSLKRVSRLNERANVRPPLPLILSQMPAGVCIAMLAGGRFIGILNFTSKNPARQVSGEQIKALNLLAGAAASALEAASLLERLRSAEARYRSLSDSAADIVFRYELLPEPHFGYINPATTSTTGYTPGEQYADPNLIFRIIHPDDRHLMERVLRGEVASRDVVTMRCVHRNGSIIWIEQRNTNVLDDNGRLVAIDGIARDITERKNLEEQLRQSQKMEAMGLLAGGVAHDFNNLLTVIIGYSDLVLDDEMPRASIVRKIGHVKKAATQAASLTGELLAFGRRQSFQPTALDINAIVLRNSIVLRRILGEDVELISALGAGPWLVKADAGQIEQILMNLAVNARAAMPHGGRIIVETTNITLEKAATGNLAGGPGPYVMLAVSDTGCGMDTSTQARIFEPFYTTKEVGQGTGLGLSIVYGIVKQSGGHIRVCSEVGKGSRFEILLPRTEEEEEAVEPVSITSERGDGTETILLVDDDEGVRQFVSTFLQARGYNLLVARDGNEALEIFHHHNGQVALLLTDLIMPGMTGTALVESLNQLNQNMRVLYMSGYASGVVDTNCRLDPRIPLIRKPFTPAGLLNKIRATLDSHAVTLKPCPPTTATICLPVKAEGPCEECVDSCAQTTGHVTGNGD